MNSIIRVASAVNKVTALNPLKCTENVIDIINKADEKKPDIIVFPSYALCSKSCGSFENTAYLADLCEEQLANICTVTKELSTYIIVGLMKSFGSAVINVSAVLYEGKIIGYVPNFDDFEKCKDLEYPSMLSPETVFGCGSLSFCVLNSGIDDVAVNIPRIAKSGCDLVVMSSYYPVIAGKTAKDIETLKVLSEQFGVAIVVSNGGVGETSSPYVYNGYCAIIECGNTLVYQRTSRENFFNMCDIDTDIIRTQKRYKGMKKPYYSVSACYTKKGLLRPIDRNPFVPNGKFFVNKYLQDLFSLQCISLSQRMSNTGIDKLVLGVSGGLDSTLALLVCAKACESLKIPSENIICVTMQGFATSSRTYKNALTLINALECTHINVPISEAVANHLKDIGHDENLKDVTYENAQARERTQILFDLSNKYGGIVVGTGDLSEEALGWCTFGGDHLAGYNVNVGIPKSVIRLLVRHISKNYLNMDIEKVLDDILETPISPELVILDSKVDEDEEISQKTEDIVGPFELIDFFIYYLVKYKLRPEKIFYYALIAFAGVYERAFIKEKLIGFIKRFYTSQFKRSCAPDSGVVTDVSLSMSEFYIPSDCRGDAWLNDIENIEFE